MQALSSRVESSRATFRTLSVSQSCTPQPVATPILRHSGREDEGSRHVHCSRAPPATSARASHAAGARGARTASTFLLRGGRDGVDQGKKTRHRKIIDRRESRQQCRSDLRSSQHV